MNTDTVTRTARSTLPRAYEREETFHEALYDWMDRAPWVAISAAAHMVLFLILQAIPWSLIVTEEESVVGVTPVPPALPPDEPPVEEPPEVQAEEVAYEPVIEEKWAMLCPTEPVDEAPVVPSNNAELFDTDALDDTAFPEIGLGGGPRFTGRMQRRRSCVPKDGGDTERALADGLTWLARHQSPDGSWDADGFSSYCGAIGAGVCDGAGSGRHDVGMTGLALLAFLGEGSSTRGGSYRTTVTRGVRWLRDQQDYASGLIGNEIGHDFLYDHAIATLALAEAYYASGSPLLRGTVQKATSYILRARNPYGAWRYDVPPTGANDTSLTGWMVFALKAAQEAGIEVEPAAFAGALAWIDEATDPATGRVGYDAPGSVSSRVTGINDHFPPARGEAMTAVGLLCRFFLGQDPDDQPLMVQHADLLKRRPPEWEPGVGCDMYYWYYGSYAMYQMGDAHGGHWSAWNRAMRRAVLDSQRRDGDFEGSWDPVGPWGGTGGRVYSTALMVLCLEVYFRYARVLGAR